MTEPTGHAVWCAAVQTEDLLHGPCDCYQPIGKIRSALRSARWTKESKAALRQLETALAACQVAGVALCGMDDQLLAYPATALDALKIELGGYYAAQRKLSDEGLSLPLADGGAYRESGGW